MKMICERCGRFFQSAPRCPHCGALVETQDDDPEREVPLVWGWAAISLNATGTLRKANSRELKAEWLKLEEFTVMKLLNSQARVFDEDRETVRVLVKEDLLNGLIDGVRSAFPDMSVTFEPVGEEFTDAAALNTLLASR